MIATYTDLQSAVAGWLHRTDLTARIQDFITLAEVQMNSDLDSRSMELTATLTTVAGTAMLALPADMVEMRRLRTTTSPMRVLKYATPDELSSEYAYGAALGTPISFTVVSGSLELAPTPDAAYSLELVYRQRVPSLSATNATNWVLTQSPDVYLYGALVAAHPFTMDDGRLPVFQQLYKRAVDAVNSIDWYSGSTLRVRAY